MTFLFLEVSDLFLKLKKDIKNNTAPEIILALLTDHKHIKKIKKYHNLFEYKLFFLSRKKFNDPKNINGTAI